MSVPTTPTSGLHTETTRLFRRRTTIVPAVIMSTVLAVVAIFLGASEFGHGILPVLSAPAGALPLIVFVLITGVWPHVVIGSDNLMVYNSFFTYKIPLGGIVDMRNRRMGVVITTANEKKIAVTAYTSGSGARPMGHEAAASALIGAIDKAREFVPPDDHAQHERTVEWRNVYAAAASIVIAFGVIYGAARTYH
jgi:hypothetical protein